MKTTALVRDRQCDVAPNVGDPFALARRMKTPVWVYDTDNCRIAFANEAACEIWRAENEEALKVRDLADGMTATVAQRLRQYQRDFIEKDARFNEFWTLYPHGEPVTVKVFYSGFVMPDGRMAMMCEAPGETGDVPETLRSIEALLHTDVMITLYGSEGDSLYANPAARKSQPGHAHKFRDLFCQSSDFKDMRRRWQAHGEARSVAKVKTTAGERWLDLSVKPCLDAATGNDAILVTAVDVSELKTARDKASFLADRDQLTGCYNRSFVKQRLDQLGNVRSQNQTRFALLFIDIDNFKHVNDSYGHEVGDTILKTFADRVLGMIRRSDIMARMGGDEFVIVLGDVESHDALHDRVEAIRTESQKPIDCGTVRMSVTTSIGVSIVDADDIPNWSETLKQADIALYSSKKSGRNKTTFFNDELGAEVSERNWLEAEVKKAIEQETFSLHYQPRVDIKTGRVIAAEALLRWQHSERGFIAPDAFIPVCEELGLIDDIGLFVFTHASRQLEKWRLQGLEAKISVNVSPQQFQHPLLVDTLRQIVSERSFPPECLELEITETSLFGGDEVVAEKMRSIVDLGFNLALDDFGTGYSNLAHISHFPMHCIKLDKSFVQKLPATGPLLRLILTLAKQIGATTVAEGVERQEQVEWLAHHDCDQLQGFLFSKAVPARDFEQACETVEKQAKHCLELIPIRAA